MKSLNIPNLLSIRDFMGGGPSILRFHRGDPSILGHPVYIFRQLIIYIYMELNSQKLESEAFLAEFEDALRALIKASASQQNLLVVKCNSAQSRCRNQLESYKLEIRAPSIAPEIKHQHKNFLEALQEHFRKLQNELDIAKQEHQRHQLVAQAGDNRDENADIDGMAVEQAQLVGDRVQEKTGAALTNTRRQAQETLEIARNIEASMAKQEEQLEGVGKELDTMQNNLIRSKKLLGSMAKQAAGDRCIQIICCLITSAVAIVIVLYAIDFGGEDSKPLKINN
eukprot:GEMP01034557.1.p1 GENE.GEMP01034557.1~~GEMP01034557.1.p1  ORF type:complete len:282 (+),score=28.63 GEMP01034557.1:218-1063(+)